MPRKLLKYNTDSFKKESPELQNSNVEIFLDAENQKDFQKIGELLKQVGAKKLKTIIAVILSNKYYNHIYKIEEKNVTAIKVKAMTMSSENEKMMNELESLLKFNDEKEKLELEATLLNLKFVKIIEDAMKQEGISKKNLAEKLETSKSYITQILSGDKLLNMKTLAKMERNLNLNFTIEAYPKHLITTKA